MSNLYLKSQLHRDQLTWFLGLLLNEREIFELSASTGIIPDVDRLYALPRRSYWRVSPTHFWLWIARRTRP